MAVIKPNLEKQYLNKSRNMLIIYEKKRKKYILAHFTSVSITSPSPTPSFPHLTHDTLLPTEEITSAHVPNAEAAGTAECWCLPYRFTL